MTNHPLNLAYRFFLELTAVYLTYHWGWNNFQGPTRIATAFLLPAALMLLWGGFRYPKDHGKGLIEVSGKKRLAIEVFVLSIPIILNILAGNTNVSLIFLAAIILHYALSKSRVKMLLNN